MYEDTQQHLERILVLVKLCPEKLQEKCFELLLSTYLENHVKKSTPSPKGEDGDPNAASNNSAIPDAIKTRFHALATRTKVTVQKASELFDFNVDPFTYHGLSLPDGSTREKMRNVALLLALKNYLTSASWEADWKEFRATCLDHSCWDQSNYATIMKNDWFKSASLATGINLSPSGIKAADALFAKLVASGTDS